MPSEKMKSRSVADIPTRTRICMKRFAVARMYEQLGCEDGHDLDDWLRAEARSPAPPKRPPQRNLDPANTSWKTRSALQPSSPGVSQMSLRPISTFR